MGDTFEADKERFWSTQELPRVIPVFPLDGALLLPRGRLPLNIFEPRYLTMVKDALSGAGMIGMIQPRDPATYTRALKPEVYDIGCLGRIVEHSETDDGRLVIALQGVSRFRVLQELATSGGYRRVSVSYDEFSGDMAPVRTDPGGRDDLVQNLRGFFEHLGVQTDWAAVESAPDEALINSVAMMCPFPGVEKQALLEAMSLADRASVLNTLMALSASGGDAQVAH